MKGKHNGTRSVYHRYGGMRFWGLWIGLSIGCLALLAAPRSIALAATLIRANQINLADSFNFTNTFTTATITSNDGVSPNLVTLDWRGTSIPSNTSLNKTCAYNITTGGNTDSMIRCQMTASSVPAAGAIVSLYTLTSLANSTTGGNVVDGASTEGQVTGTLAGTVSIVSGNEMPATVTSTGGTVTTAVGGQGYIFNSLGSTTVITNAYGLWGIGCGGKISGTPPTNCYGVFADRQLSAGGTRNYAIGVNGIGLILYDTNLGIGGLDFEDTSHATHRFFYLDSGNLLNFQAPTTNGITFRSSDAVARATLTSSGWSFPGQITSTLATGTAPFSIASTTPVANLTASNHPLVQYCGATSGGTQACAKAQETSPLVVFGEVTLNTATSQSITTLPFTSSTSYSCTGSDLTTAAGIVSFNTYAAASVTIQESGGVNTDHLRYSCSGF